MNLCWLWLLIELIRGGISASKLTLSHTVMLVWSLRSTQESTWTNFVKIQGKQARCLGMPHLQAFYPQLLYLHLRRRPVCSKALWQLPELYQKVANLLVSSTVLNCSSNSAVLRSEKKSNAGAWALTLISGVGLTQWPWVSYFFSFKMVNLRNGVLSDHHEWWHMHCHGTIWYFAIEYTSHWYCSV